MSHVVYEWRVITAAATLLTGIGAYESALPAPLVERVAVDASRTYVTVGAPIDAQGDVPNRSETPGSPYPQGFPEASEPYAAWSQFEWAIDRSASESLFFDTPAPVERVADRRELFTPVRTISMPVSSFNEELSR